jgi:hypothetical protein
MIGKYNLNIVLDSNVDKIEYLKFVNNQIAKSNKMITNFPHNKNIINKQLKNDIEEELSKLLGAIII